MPTKTLQITNKPAYPSIDGGCLGMAKMSGFYDSHPDFELDILTLETFKHPFDKKEFDKNLSDHVTVYSVKIDTKPSVGGAIKALASNKSYNLSRFKSSEFEKKLKEILTQNSYDYIQLENIFVAHYIPKIRKLSEAKIILNSANIEYEIWQRMSKKSNWVKNKYFRILSKQLQSEEELIWEQVDRIICATKKDEATIRKIVPQKKLTTLPFFLSLEKYKVVNTTHKTPSFFHIGAMDWLPNIEGLEWFIDCVWGKLETNSELYLAGKSMPPAFIKHIHPKIKAVGFVNNAIEFIQQHDVMIVPLLSGSGIRVKIIEAMALGKCVISTSIGAEGINYSPNKNILIANSAKEFTETIHELTSNPEKINTIGKEARKFIEREHDILLMKPLLIDFLTRD